MKKTAVTGGLWEKNNQKDRCFFGGLRGAQ